ncbi:Hypothetical predicted protein [Olea europaea subsp. europaea]|uniref:Uncharacterized protein n=1 Tax=Olea europaea subsp. europaea TaxID=158383 RepID=A0A8S0RCW6_OLEEU|nr:Hypothetical predicted protein [Olea europaea subsp. europaea]
MKVLISSSFLHLFKTLIRTADLFINPAVNKNPIPHHWSLRRSPPLVTPRQLFPSLFIPQSHTSLLQFPQHQKDAESH